MRRAAALLSAAIPAVTAALSMTLASCNNDNLTSYGLSVHTGLPRGQHLDQQVWLCTEASAIHEAETTRGQDPLQAANSVDQLRLRARARHFLDHATGDQLRVLLQQQQRESQLLRDLMRDDLPRLKAEELRQRLEEQDTVLLSLREERLRLRDQLNMREDCR